MKIKSFEHQFKGFGIHSSKCIVEIRDGETESYITFIDTNQGTSVTNASEQLANEIRHMAKNKKVRFFERYVRNKLEKKEGLEDTYDYITYLEKDGKLYSPKWTPLKREAYNHIIQGNDTPESSILDVEELEFELELLDEKIQSNDETYQDTEEGKRILSKISKILRLLG